MILVVRQKVVTLDKVDSFTYSLIQTKKKLNVLVVGGKN
jgi:anthranilate/para-aminobenzoate synthase component II